MKKELNKILWNNVDIKGDRPMKKELQVDLETFINQKLQEVEQRKIEEILKTIDIRDAYKIPFSEAEIQQELLLEDRIQKEIANRYYQKGRNDENGNIINSLKTFNKKL